MRLGRDRRADVLDREPDRASLEGRELRRPPEDVSVELLVDAHDVAVVHRVHGVAAAAEVDEVEKREVILELVERDRDALRELRRVEHRSPLVAAGGEELGEERLEDSEALGCNRPDRALGQRLTRIRAPCAGGNRRPRPCAPPRAVASPSATASRSASGSSTVARPFWRSTQPASSSAFANAVSNTPSSTVPASASVRSTHQAVSSETAMRAVPIGSPICQGRGTRCASTSKSSGTRKSRSRRVAKRMSPLIRETLNVRTPERSRSLPTTYQLPSSSRSAYGFTVRSVRLRALRAQVAELDRPLLRDRGLELRQAAGELGGVVRRAHAHALGRLGRRLREPGAPEREVLEREPERLRVGELALEVVERGLERRELVVVELEPVEEVVLRAERVQLFAGELVALRLEGHAERGELGAIGVEPARERLVGHLRVALDVRPSRRARSAAAAPP